MVILANQTLNCIATKQTAIKDVGQGHLTGGGQELRKIKKVIGTNMGSVYRQTVSTVLQLIAAEMKLTRD